MFLFPERNYAHWRGWFFRDKEKLVDLRQDDDQ